MVTGKNSSYHKKHYQIHVTVNGKGAKLYNHDVKGKVNVVNLYFSIDFYHFYLNVIISSALHYCGRNKLGYDRQGMGGGKIDM